MEEPKQPPDPSMPDPEDMGCGVKTIWETPIGDPFFHACAAHDAAYNAQAAGVTNLPSSKPVDRDLLRGMLAAAQGSFVLKARAYLFYGFARLYGAAGGWPQPEE